MKDINFLITVTRRNDAGEFADFFARCDLPVLWSAPGLGTTDGSHLDLLGLQHSEKILWFSVAGGDRIALLMNRLRSEMYIDLPDRGIAVASPLVSVGGASALETLTRGDFNEKDGLVMNTPYELIVIFANNNTTDLVMDAARAGGAGGGTVVHTKGTAGTGQKKFFGISLAEEREMILIVAAGDKRNAIIKSVMDKAGASTPAAALAFSLPISHAAGFSFGQEKDG